MKLPLNHLVLLILGLGIVTSCNKSLDLGTTTKSRNNSNLFRKVTINPNVKKLVMPVGEKREEEKTEDNEFKDFLQSFDRQLEPGRNDYLILRYPLFGCGDEIFDLLKHKNNLNNKTPIHIIVITGHTVRKTSSDLYHKMNAKGHQYSSPTQFVNKELFLLINKASSTAYRSMGGQIKVFQYIGAELQDSQDMSCNNYLESVKLHE